MRRPESIHWTRSMPPAHGIRLSRAWRWRRRRLLGSALIASAALANMAVIACSNGISHGGGNRQGAGSAGPNATPRRGGTLTLSGDFLRGFDPHVLQATDTGLFGMFYSTLIRTNPKTYELEPDLASKWETPSQTELVFTLAPNARWHDKPPVNGRKLEANDIIFSYKRVGSSDPRFINKSYLADIDTMEALDTQTLKISLKRPVVTQLINLATASLKILAPEAIGKSDKVATADAVVGTGAFLLQQSQPHVGTTLVRNPNYFKAGLPYLDRVQLKAFQDAESEWSAFLAGQIDHRWVPGQDSAQFAGSKKGQYTLDWVGDLGFDLTMANVQKKPFDDERVTRALRLLIDHEEFKNAWSDVWFGRGRNTICFDAATGDNWDLSEDEYAKSLEWQQPKDNAIKEALSLLSAAGFTKDKPLRFTLSGTSGETNPYAQAAVQLLQAQFKRYSQGAVDPTIKLYDTATWTSVRANGDFEYFTAGQNPGGEDPDATFSSAYQTGGSRNYGKMSDPQLDQMFARLRAIFDEQQRKKAVQDTVRYMIDHLPYGSLVARYVLSATQQKVNAFPAEGTSFKSGEHYETAWAG